MKHPSCLTRRRFFRSALAGPAASLAAPGGQAREAQASQRGTKEALAPPPSLPSLRELIHPLPAEEYLARQQKARERMAEAGLDAVLLMGGSSLLYFTAMNWGRSERLFAAVLPRRGEIAYVCPAFEASRASELIRFAKDLRTWEEDESPYRLLRQVLQDQGVRTLGIEETTPYFVTYGLAQEAAGLAQASADPVTVGCRMIKSAREVALMELAAQATGRAITAAFRQLREGMTPRQLAEAVTAAHAQQGVRPGFVLVAFGPSSAFPHGSRKPQQLREGDVVLVDTGCSVEGYQSDVTRTVVFGRPSDRQRQVWETVKKAQEAALRAARPGLAAAEVDAAARRLIEQAGWGPGYKFFPHRLGHGIGLDPHEWPYLVRGNTLPLEPGMTFSDEPGIYIPGEFGVRLEDVMVVTATGARLLTSHSASITL